MNTPNLGLPSHEEYKALSITNHLPGEWCDGCGVEIHETTAKLGPSLHKGRYYCDLCVFSNEGMWYDEYQETV